MYGANNTLLFTKDGPRMAYKSRSTPIYKKTYLEHSLMSNNYVCPLCLILLFIIERSFMDWHMYC